MAIVCAFEVRLLPEEKLNEMNAGYGVRFAAGQDASHFEELARKAGFHAVSRKQEVGWFFLEFRKQ